MRAAQIGLRLDGGRGVAPDRKRIANTGLIGALGDGDPLPPGPFTVSLSTCDGPEGVVYETIPYVVKCGNGQAVAGHVPSREIAEAIADALNRAFPP